jgi:arylsulfatase A-like enzyme
MKKNAWFVLGAALILVLGGLYLVLRPPADSKNRPNIVFVYADDMDSKLLPYMKQTNALIGKQGAVFTNYFVTASTCCPSRSTILRGQYPHNTGIFENSPGFEEFYEKGNDEETLATWMDNAGYHTSYMGKYLNLYPAGVKRTYVSPGWDDWHVFLYGPSDNFYFAYTMNENGKLVKYGKKDYEYSTDVIRDRSFEFIEKSVKRNSPFFLMLSVYAPHGPTLPAPRHADLYEELEYPQSEAFREADISDKPEIVLELIRSNGTYEVQDANELFRKRVQSMQSVDDLVADLVKKLEETGELDNTYFFFTSDNGFHMGEHNLPSGKMLPYDEDIRVPLLVRGPGIAPGTMIDQIVANIDLAPTITELAHAKTAEFVDGRSFVSLLTPNNAAAAWRNALLIEVGKLDQESPVIAFRGIRTDTFVYAEYESGELEFYDRVNDPHELENIAATLDEETLSTLHSWLEQLKTCQAEACRQAEVVPLDHLGFQP